MLYISRPEIQNSLYEKLKSIIDKVVSGAKSTYMGDNPDVESFIGYFSDKFSFDIKGIEDIESSIFEHLKNLFI